MRKPCNSEIYDFGGVLMLVVDSWQSVPECVPLVQPTTVNTEVVHMPTRGGLVGLDFEKTRLINVAKFRHATLVGEFDDMEFANVEYLRDKFNPN